MEIMSRQQAITARSLRYFTGVPCKNGHVAERYTKCSVCIECLHPTFEKPAAAPSLAYTVLAARMQMIRIKIVIHSDDFDFFVASAHALGMAREPLLPREEVLTRFSARARGDGKFMHAFKCFPDDAGALYKLQEDLNFARLSPEQQQLVRDAASRRIDQ